MHEFKWHMQQNQAQQKLRQFTASEYVSST